jgi:hypothetical protein
VKYISPDDPIEYRYIDMDRRERVSHDEAYKRGSMRGCLWRSNAVPVFKGEPALVGFGYRHFTPEALVVADKRLPLTMTVSNLCPK